MDFIMVCQMVEKVFLGKINSFIVNCIFNTDRHQLLSDAIAVFISESPFTQIYNRDGIKRMFLF